MFDSELSILAIYGLVVAISVALQTSGAMGQLGISYFLSARDEARSASGTTARLDRAQNNAIQAMVLFAPAILILAVKGTFSDTTLLAAQVFPDCPRDLPASLRLWHHRGAHPDLDHWLCLDNFSLLPRPLNFIPTLWKLPDNKLTIV